MTLTQLKAIIFAPDKVLHAKYSVLVLAGIVAMTAFGYWIGLHPVSIILLVAGWSAGAAVEGAQRSVNQAAIAQDKPKPHEVSFLDALASAIWPTVAAIVFEVLRKFDLLPAALNTFISVKTPFWM